MKVMSGLLEGAVLGFSIAAPVGPIALLCIRRTINRGFAEGVASGLGAAVADTLYGAIVGFGLASLHKVVLKMQMFLSILGGIFLIYLGIKTIFAKPATQASETSAGKGLAGAFLSTFFLTLSNPLTILAFAAVVAALGLETSVDYATATSFVTGVFLGSAGWYLLLSGIVTQIRSQVNEGMFRLINQISGIIILAFAIYILWSAGYMLWQEVSDAIAGYVGEAKGAMVASQVMKTILPF
jgi:threonine/homoserine/homoserine lactone efflux protein